jgi:hypothetical protein
VFFFFLFLTSLGQSISGETQIGGKPIVRQTVSDDGKAFFGTVGENYMGGEAIDPYLSEHDM